MEQSDIDKLTADIVDWTEKARIAEVNARVELEYLKWLISAMATEHTRLLPRLVGPTRPRLRVLVSLLDQGCGTRRAGEKRYMERYGDNNSDSRNDE